MISIVPLTEERLSEAIALVTEVFPPEYEFEPADEELAASLDPETHQDFLSRTGFRPTLQYWVALEAAAIIGVVGLNEYKKDPDEIVWLGWFCVNERAKRQGVGTKLLRFVIEEAKMRGKKTFRLYSSTDPDELYSHGFFKKFGFRLIHKEPFPGLEELDKLTFELNLTKAQVS